MNLKNEQEIRRAACIFGKSGKRLTKYQQQLNEVAGDLCVDNTLLLYDKEKLLELSREQVHKSGYVYVKGKSRSKVLTTATTTEKHQTREKVDKQERGYRIESIVEQVSDIQKHIELKEKIVVQAQSIQNYKLCDQMTDEILSLKAKRRELEAALRSLQQKQKRSNQYYARKAQSNEGGSSSSSISQTSATADDRAQPSADFL